MRMDSYEERLTMWPLFINCSGHISLDAEANSLPERSPWGNRCRGRNVPLGASMLKADLSIIFVVEMALAVLGLTAVFLQKGEL